MDSKYIDYIAGHEFDWFGGCVKPRSHLGGSRCPIRWVDIRHVDESYVNQTGIAHTGGLVLKEAQEIVAKVKKERDAYDWVMKTYMAK